MFHTTRTPPASPRERVVLDARATDLKLQISQKRFHLAFMARARERRALLSSIESLESALSVLNRYLEEGRISPRGRKQLERAIGPLF